MRVHLTALVHNYNMFAETNHLDNQKEEENEKRS